MNTSLNMSVGSGIIVANTSAPSCPMLPKEQYNVIRDVYFVLTGIVICIGLIFNTLALTVFAASPSLRRTTTAHYLMALAVADSLCLLTEMLRWLAQPTTFQISANVLNTSNVMCKLVYVLRYFGRLMSAWITVAITTERFITIKFPMKVKRISTPKVSKIIISMIAVVSLLMSLFPFWVVGLRNHHDNYKCQIMPNYKMHYDIGLWVTIKVGELIVPSIIVSILTWYIHVLLRARKKQQYQLQEHSTKGFVEHRIKLPVSSLEKQLTGMLLAVAVFFVTLRLPYIIIFYVNRAKCFWKPLDLELNYRIYVAYKLTDVLAMTNYAINFFLYFFCGSTFRKQMTNLSGCRHKKKRSTQWTIGTMTSTVRRSSTASSATRSSLSRSQLSGINGSNTYLREYKAIELREDVTTNTHLHASNV